MLGLTTSLSSFCVPALLLQTILFSVSGNAAPEIFTAHFLTDISETPISVQVGVVCSFLALWQCFFSGESVPRPTRCWPVLCSGPGWFLQSKRFLQGRTWFCLTVWNFRFVRTPDNIYNLSRWRLYPGNSSMNEKWLDSVIKDDPVVGSNTRGTISYATDGPDTRTSQVNALNRPLRRMAGQDMHTSWDYHQVKKQSCW